MHHGTFENQVAFHFCNLGFGSVQSIIQTWSSAKFRHEEETAKGHALPRTPWVPDTGQHKNPTRIEPTWGLLFRGGSYLPFYSIKRWVPTPLGVYKLKVPTPLRHYNLNTVAPNQSPEINRKKHSDYKMAGADPPKKNSYNETAC